MQFLINIWFFFLKMDVVLDTQEKINFVWNRAFPNKKCFQYDLYGNKIVHRYYSCIIFKRMGVLQI